MKLVLTGKELVELGNIALKAHHLTGAVMQEIGQKLDQETLLMTDKELLEEAVRDAIADIESVGGVVQKGIEDNYIIILPETFTVDFYKEFGEIMTVVSPFVLKAVKFFNKHKETLKRFVGYVKAAAGVFGPILETKELVKDFEDLDDESDLVVAKFREISAKYKKQEIEWEIETVKHSIEEEIESHYETCPHCGEEHKFMYHVAEAGPACYHCTEKLIEQEMQDELEEGYDPFANFSVQ